MNNFEAMLETAHQMSSAHASNIKRSNKCGCFFCMATFEPTLISEWVDSGSTAICPFCGIDSVLGSASGYPITDTFLRAMHKYWFSELDEEDEEV